MKAFGRSKPGTGATGVGPGSFFRWFSAFPADDNGRSDGDYVLSPSQWHHTQPGAEKTGEGGARPRFVWVRSGAARIWTAGFWSFPSMLLGYPMFGF